VCEGRISCISPSIANNFSKFVSFPINITPPKEKKMKYHAYPGRWQSPHRGHRYIIDKNLAEGKPVLILIRPMPIDDKNPFRADEVEDMLRAAFREEIAQGLVETQILKVDIASINTGRGVGFDVVSHTGATPEHVKRISATEIRRKIREGDPTWRDSVMPGVEEMLEAKFK
jgi:nicotinamide mononucleotide adenylyltransferase